MRPGPVKACPRTISPQPRLGDCCHQAGFTDGKRRLGSQRDGAKVKELLGVPCPGLLTLEAPGGRWGCIRWKEATCQPS